MKNVFPVARIALGLLFAILGLNGLAPFLPMPPPGAIPDHALQFTMLLGTTHYVWLTAGAQVVAGILLLIDRYVMFALIVLAAELANIFMFHLTMWPQAIVPMPILALILWIITAWPLRERFAELFTAKDAAAA